MYKCSLCNKELDTLDEYLEHTKICVAEQKQKENNLVEMNNALNKVKAAKEYYEDQMRLFEENYPEAYEMNFGDKKIKTEAIKKAQRTNSNEYANKYYPGDDEIVKDFLKMLGLR